jgi:hypothetical protein
MIKQMFEDGSCFTDIQSAAKTDSPTLSRWLRELGLDLDIRAIETTLPGGVEKLKELRAVGCSVRDIAANYKIPSSIVQRCVNTLGLAKRRGPKPKAKAKPLAAGAKPKVPKVPKVPVRLSRATDEAKGRSAEEEDRGPHVSLVQQLAERQIEALSSSADRYAGYKLKIVEEEPLAYSRRGWSL